MSAYLMGIVLKTELGGPTMKAVAVKLADHAHDDGTHIFPSIRTVARQSEVSERSAQYALKKLIAIGVVVRVRTGGGRMSSEYRFDMPALMELHRQTMERWQAEDKATERTACRTGAKSAPVQPLHPSGATGAPKPLFKPSSKKPVPFTSEQEAVRARAVQSSVQGLKNGFGSEAGPRDRTRELAEGYGLDVDRLEASASGPAEFRGLCERELAERLPGLKPALVRAAMSGDLQAKATVYGLLALSAGARA